MTGISGNRKTIIAALDEEDPIEFGGTYIIYQVKQIPLSPRAIYLGGSLSDEEAGRYEYVSNNITQAFRTQALINGTEGRADPVFYQRRRSRSGDKLHLSKRFYYSVRNCLDQISQLLAKMLSLSHSP